MSKDTDPRLALPPVDQTRRRLTKAGLAAPAVLGALASRPVLGDSLHNCTPSGHISGFASPNPNGLVCSRLGLSPSDYAGMDPQSWPTGFIGTNNKPLPFNGTPDSGRQFANAFEAQVKSGVNEKKNRPATVLEVLRGYPVNNQGGPDSDYDLVALSSNVDVALGQEAIAACMNALGGAFGGAYPVGFPISAIGVVDMFNSIFTLGFEQVTAEHDWSKAEVIEYFQSLHP